MGVRKWGIGKDLGLKVGDKVFVATSGSYHYGRTRRVATIERITPSGLLVVGNSKFYPDGTRQGGDTYTWTKLEPWSAEEEQEEKERERHDLLARNVQYMAGRTAFINLDTQDLETIKGILLPFYRRDRRL